MGQPPTFHIEEDMSFKCQFHPAFMNNAVEGYLCWCQWYGQPCTGTYFVHVTRSYAGLSQLKRGLCCIQYYFGQAITDKCYIASTAPTARSCGRVKPFAYVKS